LDCKKHSAAGKKASTTVPEKPDQEFHKASPKKAEKKHTDFTVKHLYRGILPASEFEDRVRMSPTLVLL
jgi:hypothetical protein